MEENKNKLSWTPIIKLYLINGFAPLLTGAGELMGAEYPLNKLSFISLVIAYFSVRITYQTVKEKTENMTGQTLPLMMLPFLSLLSGIFWVSSDRYTPAVFIMMACVVSMICTLVMYYHFMRSSVLKIVTMVVFAVPFAVYCFYTLAILALTLLLAPY